MDFEVNDLEKILESLEEGTLKLAYTEHFLEKMEHRNIDDDDVYYKLVGGRPKQIRKFEKGSNLFELSYEWDEANDIIVIIVLSQAFSVDIITAFLRELV